jgi:ligand-binding sensor domain-containing protein
MGCVGFTGLSLLVGIVVTLFAFAPATAAELTWSQYKNGSTISNILDLGDTLIILSESLMKVAKADSGNRIFHRIDDPAISGKTLTAAARRPRDTILIGTSQGLAVYGNNGWNLIGSARISALLTDSRHTTWVGTSAGLSIFNGGALEVVDSFTALVSGGIKTITEDTAHAIWISASYDKVIRYDGTTWKSQPALFDVTAMTCWKGTMVATTYMPASGRGGVFFFLNGRWTRADSTSPGYPFDGFVRYSCLAVDSTGNLVVGTANGAYRYNGASWSTFNNTTGGVSVSALHCDTKGVLWAGTDRDLSRCKDNSWEPFFAGNSILPSNRVNALLSTKNNDLWIGTQSGIVVKHGDQWTYLDSCRQKVSCLAEDVLGNIWIGAANSIYKYTDGAWTLYSTGEPPFPCSYIFGLVPENSGRVYVSVFGGPGTRNSALGLFDGTSWSSIKSGMYPYTITADSKNGFFLWSYFVAGLSRYADGKETVYTTGITNLGSAAITEDPQGTIWLAYEGTLAKFDGTQWTTVAPIPLPPSNNVNSIHCDSSGAVWVGTLMQNGWGGGSLMRYYEGAWSFFGNQSSPFPNSGVLCFDQDAKGNLALGTEGQGLFILGPERNTVSTVRSISAGSLVPSQRWASLIYPGRLGIRNIGQNRDRMPAVLFDLRGRTIDAQSEKGGACVIRTRIRGCIQDDK